MKYAGMPAGMWILFAGSFRKHLTSLPGCGGDAKRVTTGARAKYKEIIAARPLPLRA